jgi:lipoprotein NlpD
LSPAPVADLRNTERGSYRGHHYEVKKGDTLYFISYITDKNIKDLIRYNHLSPPYTIYPGQKINLWGPVYSPPAYGKSDISQNFQAQPRKSIKKNAAKITNTSLKNSKSSGKVGILKNKHETVEKYSVKTVESSHSNEYGDSRSNRNVKSKSTKPNLTNAKVSKWLWPAKGRVIRKFSVVNQGNKGIDIAGQRGQPVVSSAAGVVVYSGNALRGYGNLVIIKHNDNYLSAYAHNDRLLVREGQSVKAGQKIATMGSSGTNSVRLHFEIRYQGKPVNPKRYLP